MAQTVNITYDPQKNIVFVEADEKDFDPKYFQYMMEYLDIPLDATKKFLGTPTQSHKD